MSREDAWARASESDRAQADALATEFPELREDGAALALMRAVHVRAQAEGRDRKQALGDWSYIRETHLMRSP